MRYVVHFIGDIHNPLHAGNAADSNGNALTAYWFGGVVYPFDTNTTNLHSIWDTGIIETRIRRDFYNNPNLYVKVGTNRAQQHACHSRLSAVSAQALITTSHCVFTSSLA